MCSKLKGYSGEQGKALRSEHLLWLAIVAATPVSCLAMNQSAPSIQLVLITHIEGQISHRGLLGLGANHK